MTDLTDDAFLSGAVRLWQPAQGYRAATDPVFLAAACAARAEQEVLDLGCGVGAAALCLGRRVPGLRLTGLEVQPAYAELATRNAGRNDIALEVVVGDAARMPEPLRARSFDHVLTNPPFFEAAAGLRADDPGRDRAFRESMTLEHWIDAGLRRLRPGGEITLIHRAERLTEILGALAPRCGAIRILPLAARQGRAAKRVIVIAKKGSRAPLQLLAPFILHDGARHEEDAPDFTQAAVSVLSKGAALAAVHPVPA
ncbi:tRNA1(Val) A37 N6-methylase TrmN6 [Rubricella aquisinus]|uniref:tRNA1(Val) A37 N6-methylase TrmN6 n=1 Tax=Rubricella aquisinus TaxID=2028108 RepID=A0A840WJA2_9RHOB|nr:methyltransferase [Rubricella aquisinus]MBB5515169.1 tRNA1(Val) A37 N6-methylase TrmN6 [Rubricella aquisinus]